MTVEEGGVVDRAGREENVKVLYRREEEEGERERGKKRERGKERERRGKREGEGGGKGGEEREGEKVNKSYDERECSGALDLSST